jgi:hypothetical protein
MINLASIYKDTDKTYKFVKELLKISFLYNNSFY